MTTSPAYTAIHWPVHTIDPTAYVMAERLRRHFHAQVTPTTDWNRGVTVLRIVAPHDAVKDAVDLYLGARTVPYTITREAS